MKGFYVITKELGVIFLFRKIAARNCVFSEYLEKPFLCVPVFFFFFFTLLYSAEDSQLNIFIHINICRGGNRKLYNKRR